MKGLDGNQGGGSGKASKPITRALNQSSIRQKVDSLLSAMNPDQKIGQMIQAERMFAGPDEVKEFHLGSILSGAGSYPGDNSPAAWVEMVDAYWAASMEADADHLAIPLLYGADAVHGNSNVCGATIFPHNIGLGATGDPELAKRAAAITAREVLATGVEWTFAPTLAVARNLRWGRTYESFAEDPVVVGELGAAYIDGLQNDLGENSVMACAKHWVGDGGTQHGIDQGDTVADLEEMQRVHMAPYLPAIEAGVTTVMASFNSWNGDKCHAHRYLLTEVLKEDLGFEGFILSDWDGINYLSNDYTEAAAMATNAGIDMFMVTETWRELFDALKQNVEQGIVPMSRIDDAVRRILAVKYAWGLFDRPRPAQRYWSNHASFGCPEHREVAREAVSKSLVLLKNKNSLLPLDPDARILVAGKNADNKGHQCGGFSVDWQGTSGNESILGGSSIWEGIKNISPDAVLSRDEFVKDVEQQEFDVAIVLIGEKPYAEGMGDIRASDDVIVEAGSSINGSMKVLEAYGQTLELARLHPEDLKTIHAISQRGIPVVAVLISGRPLVINQELAQADAFVAAWLPGSEGQGVADVIFGDHPFQGKLGFSWPGDDQNRTTENPDPALFPFGYGLTTT